MFVIRASKVDDVATLLKLAKMVYFINLPPDREIVTEKVLHSRRAFRSAAAGETTNATGARPAPGTGLSAALHRSSLFMFTLEDTATGSVLGSSQLVSQMGGPGAPNVSFKVKRKSFFSTDMRTGATHTVLQLHLDESSPTELGGLIVQPSYRHHPEKLGKFLSLVRFHFVGLHRALFADRMLAEMMADISPDGRSAMWEALGRRFINLSYDEADRFNQRSKEFMLSLLPREEIYLSLLPPEARSVVGQVGPETVPARRMLEKLGFECKDLVDPFDGGPHMEVKTDDVWLVQDSFTGQFAGSMKASEKTGRGIVSVLPSDGGFKAVQTDMCIDSKGRVKLPKDAIRELDPDEGATVGVTLYPDRSTSRPPAAKQNGRAGAKKSASKRKKTSKRGNAGS